MRVSSRLQVARDLLLCGVLDFSRKDDICTWWIPSVPETNVQQLVAEAPSP